MKSFFCHSTRRSHQICFVAAIFWNKKCFLTCNKLCMNIYGHFMQEYFSKMSKMKIMTAESKALP